MAQKQTGVFQDRKLNACEHCGTKKQIGMVFRRDGTMYFLCKPHAFLLALLQDKAAKFGLKL